MRTAALLLLALATPVAAGDEPITLRWALKEGDTFYTKTHVNQKHTMDAGGEKLNTSLNLDITVRYQVKSAGEREMIIEATYLGVDVKADELTGLSAIGEKVHNGSITLVFDEQLALSEVRGHKKLLKKFEDSEGLEHATASVLFSEAGIRELVGRPFEILPRSGVRLNESVTQADRGVVGGLNTTGKTTFKLERLQDGVAKVAVKADLAISVADGPAGAPSPDAKVDLKSELAAGTYTFDTRSGRLKEFAYDTVIGGTITTPNAGKEFVVAVVIRQKQTVRVFDKNPIRD